MIAGYYSSQISAQGSHTARNIMSHMQLRMQDLPKVLMWRLDWDSNQRPSATNTNAEPPRP